MQGPVKPLQRAGENGEKGPKRRAGDHSGRPVFLFETPHDRSSHPSSRHKSLSEKQAKSPYPQGSDPHNEPRSAQGIADGIYRDADAMCQIR